MSHAHIVTNNIAEWPLTRDRIAEIMNTALAQSGVENPSVTLPLSLDGLDLSECGIVPVVPSQRPALLPGQQAIEAAPVLIGGVWTQQWAIEGDLASVKAAMLDALADRRWTAEEAGTSVGGMPLATDRVTQGKLTAVYFKASADPAFTIPNWKLGPGVFVTLDAASIVAAGDSMRAYVQLCFDNEAAIAASIMAAEDLAALDAIDIEAGWPE